MVNKKNILIGAGVIAVLGAIVYYRKKEADRQRAVMVQKEEHRKSQSLNQNIATEGTLDDWSRIFMPNTNADGTCKEGYHKIVYPTTIGSGEMCVRNN
jgi:hypothetical protein